MERYTETSEIDLGGMHPVDRTIIILARELDTLTRLLNDVGIEAQVNTAFSEDDNYAYIEAEVVLP